MKVFQFTDLLTMRDHMSVSFITGMLTCPMRAVLGSVLKLSAPRPSRSPAMLKGSIMHKALEFYFQRIGDKNLAASDVILSEAIAAAREHYKKKEKFYDAAVLGEAIKFFEGHEMLEKKLSDFLDQNFLQKALVDDKFIKTEMAFTKLPICGYNFDGRIDLIFDSEVIDFKTTSRNMVNSPDPDRKALAISKLRHECALQLLVYKKALAQLNVQDMPLPEYFSIIEIIFTKEVPINYYKFTTKEVESVAEELTDRVSLVVDMLKHKKIYRNFRDAFCPCEYAPYCVDNSNLQMALSKMTLPKDFF